MGSNDTPNDDAEAVEEVVEAVSDAGFDPVAPPRGRQDGVHPPRRPPVDVWVMHRYGRDRLREWGLQPWGDHGLWTFPAEWADEIPDHFPIVDINGRKMLRSEKPDNPDQRYGALPWGIVPDFEKGDR